MVRWVLSHNGDLIAVSLDISNWSGDSYILINKSTINFAIPIENGFRLILNSTPFDDGNFIDIDFKSELDELTKFKRWLIA